MSRKVIVDTCFLIDWSAYRRRDLLFELFEVVFVPEAVLGELVSEDVLEWVSDLLAEGKLALFTETSEIVEEARGLVERSRELEHVGRLDLPEAICLVAGRRYNYSVVTENRAALAIKEWLPEYKGLEVLRALEVLLLCVEKGLIDRAEAEGVFSEYEEDTLHYFPREDLRRALGKL